MTTSRGRISCAATSLPRTRPRFGQKSDNDIQIEPCLSALSAGVQPSYGTPEQSMIDDENGSHAYWVAACAVRVRSECPW